MNYDIDTLIQTFEKHAIAADKWNEKHKIDHPNRDPDIEWDFNVSWALLKICEVQRKLMKQRKTAGEISQDRAKDTTKYDALEVGYHLTDDIEKHLRLAIENYRNIIDEEEFCVVMLTGDDPLLKRVKRRKFYCWPYLPSPRPDQAVFLYNKGLDKITKRLWILPSAAVMSELSTLSVVDKRYKTMQAWSVAFFEGKFWEYIRYDQQIDMLSEHEYFLANREELIKASCKPY